MSIVATGILFPEMKMRKKKRLFAYSTQWHKRLEIQDKYIEISVFFQGRHSFLKMKSFMLFRGIKIKGTFNKNFRLAYISSFHVTQKTLIISGKKVIYFSIIAFYISLN
jgi:hypothetical protein